MKVPVPKVVLHLKPQFIARLVKKQKFCRKYFTKILSTQESSRGGLEGKGVSFSHLVEEWSLHSVDRILLSMACQSFRDRNVLLHIHTNAERRVPSGVYDTCLGVCW